MNLFVKVVIMIVSMLLPSCGPTKERTVYREVNHLEETVLRLQGLEAMIISFVAGDFSECKEGSLPAFETKICRIAQASMSEQMIKISGQLNRSLDIMQDSLYGESCNSAESLGCPEPGSILDELNSIDPIDITNLQNAVNGLQDFVESLEDRFDDFDGTGSSIENVIAGLDSEIHDHETRISSIESVISGSDYYTWIWVCSGVTKANEPLLRTGDKKVIKGFVNRSSNGVETVATAGLSGNQYVRTSVRPKCNFVIYDLVSELKVCWDNTDRNSSEAVINTVCDNGGPNLISDCTCI